MAPAPRYGANMRAALTPEDLAIFLAREKSPSVSIPRDLVALEAAEAIDARAMAALECKREREWRVLGRRQPDSFEARANVRDYREMIEAEHGEPLL